MIGLGVLVYSDDVLIYAETPEQIIEILSAVLKLLAKTALKCKASKCSLFIQSVNYFGRVVARKSINPDTAKLDQVKQWPRHEKGNGLASFLDLCNYYRDLIPLSRTSATLYIRIQNNQMDGAW